MKIYIVAHKDFKNPTKDKIYMPIQVGASLKEQINPAWQKDNIGDNISSKNKSYNELTALYWIWKNSTEDIVGLCHYRRYFVSFKGKILNLIFGKQEGFLDEKNIKKMLKNCDLIIHNKTFFKESNSLQFKSMKKYPNDIEIMREVLEKNYSEYVKAYDDVMNSKSAHLLNMVIGNKDLIDKYCEWLFGVLFEFERELELRRETSFDRRIGMIAERMFDVWIKKNNIKVKECFSINTERKDWRFFS